MAALLHGLVEKGLGSDLWRVTIPDSDREQIERELLHPLFHERRELPATAIGSPMGLRIVLEHRHSKRRVLLRFEDHAGEVSVDRAQLEQADFLRYASGVLLLADPLAFPPPKTRRRSWYHDEPTCLDVLEGYQRVLRTAPRTENTRSLPLLPEQKYLAVVVTKADAVLSKAHQFWDPHRNGVFESGFWSRRADDASMVREWLEERLPRAHRFSELTRGFADVSYFFVSSYGYAHRPRAALRKDPSPIRVHEPLFALLDRFTAADPAQVHAHQRHELGEDDLL